MAKLKTSFTLEASGERLVWTPLLSQKGFSFSSSDPNGNWRYASEQWFSCTFAALKPFQMSPTDDNGLSLLIDLPLRHTSNLYLMQAVVVVNIVLNMAALRCHLGLGKYASLNMVPNFSMLLR